MDSVQQQQQKEAMPHDVCSWLNAYDSAMLWLWLAVQPHLRGGIRQGAYVGGLWFLPCTALALFLLAKD